LVDHGSGAGHWLSFQPPDCGAHPAFCAHSRRTGAGARLPALAGLEILAAQKRRFAHLSRSFEPRPAAGGIPPAVAAIALLFFLTHAENLRAKEPFAVEQKAEQAAATNAFSITSASYAGSVREKTALFEATLLVSTFATNQTVPLFGEDVAIQEFHTEARDAKLLRQGNKVALRLGEMGNAVVKVKLVIKLSGEVTKRQLAFTIPRRSPANCPSKSRRHKRTLNFQRRLLSSPRRINRKRGSMPFSVREIALKCSGHRA